MRKLDPLRLLPQRVLDMFGSDPMSLARVRIALVGIDIWMAHPTRH
jgi:hypothetical protein